MVVAVSGRRHNTFGPEGCGLEASDEWSPTLEFEVKGIGMIGKALVTYEGRNHYIIIKLTERNLADDEYSRQVILDATTTSNAELDAYGRTARVKIDDKDTNCAFSCSLQVLLRGLQDAFPSNVVDVRKLAKSLSWEHFRRLSGFLIPAVSCLSLVRQALENAPLLILMGEYLKLNFRNDIVRRGAELFLFLVAFLAGLFCLALRLQSTGTIKMLMAAECHHLYGILRPGQVL